MSSNPYQRDRYGQRGRGRGGSGYGGYQRDGNSRGSSGGGRGGGYNGSNSYHGGGSSSGSYYGTANVNRVRKPGHSGGRGHSNYSSPQNNHQVWMGEVDSRWSEADIRSIFQQLGVEPIFVRLPKDRGTSGRSFCFVNFATKELAAQAISFSGQPVPGHPGVYLKLNWAAGSTGDTKDQEDRRQGRTLKNNAGDVTNSVYVTGINGLQEQELFDAFNAKYPMQVRQVKLDHVPSGREHDSKSRQGAIVRFTLAEAARRAAAEMNDAVIGSAKIAVQMLDNATTQRVDYSRIATPQTHPALNRYTDPFNTTVCVTTAANTGRLSSIIGAKALRNHFGHYGIVLGVHDADDDGVNVVYMFRGDAQRAILNEHGAAVSGVNLKVTWGNGVAESANVPRSPVYGVDSDLGDVGIRDASEPHTNRGYVRHQVALLDAWNAIGN